MQLIASDPDIATLVSRIINGSLDLQPDFQRGEVWSETKKKRLIDSILREWHVPPIHVIQRPDTQKTEVLDGQQRLAAIRDFVKGSIKVDGMIEPIDPEIFNAHNLTYDQLPSKLKSSFDQFPIRVFRLINFKPEEPPELFYRLNQPTSLTAAEQRNAFFGPVRLQVRKLIEKFEEFGLTENVIGFSNSRMAYDDVIGKVLFCLETGEIRQKVTASVLTERYRVEMPFSDDVYSLGDEALNRFVLCRTSKISQPKLNKATFFTWLCFLSRFSDNSTGDIVTISSFMDIFESLRATMKSEDHDPNFGFRKWINLLPIYNDRSSLRVSDVSSVILRDAILSFCFADFARSFPSHFQSFSRFVNPLVETWSPLIGDHIVDEQRLLETLEVLHWGVLG